MKEEYDIVIVGGGISGLSLAKLLARMDRKVLVIEASTHIGGSISSLNYKDFNVDMGAHTLYNSYTSLIRLMEVADIADMHQAREKKKYYINHKKSFQKMTAPLHWGELLMHLPKAFFVKKEGKTVAEYYSRIMGKSNYSNFGRYALGAVISQIPDEYLASFFLKIRKEKNKNYPRSLTFRGGMQMLTEAYAKDSNITIRTNEEVQQIEKINEIYKITTQNATLESTNIALAIEADKAAHLAHQIIPELSNLLKHIPYSEVSSYGIIIPKNASATPPFTFLLDTTNTFTSIVSRDVAPHLTYRGFTIHKQGKVAKEELKRILLEKIKSSEDEILKECTKTHRLPKLTKGHPTFLENIDTLLPKGFYLTGNYFEGMSLEDCVRRSESEALRFISQQK